MLSSRGLARLSMLPLLAAVAAAGCTGPQPRVDSTTSVTQSPTPSPATSPSPSVPSAAGAAVQTYTKFISAVWNAQKNPPAKFGNRLASDADFTRYSFDPERARQLNGILILTQKNRAWRGSPPLPNVSVISVTQSAQPYPTITLRVCFSPSSTWQEYDRKTGDVLQSPKSSGLPNEVEVIYYKKQWGVYKVAAGEGKCE